MVNECYLASHSWDTLFFKLQNFKETHLNSLVWVALHINFATLQLHHVLSERSNPWHMLKKRKGKKKKIKPQRMALMLDLRVCAAFLLPHRGVELFMDTKCRLPFGTTASQLHDYYKSTDRLVFAIAFLNWGEVAQWEFTKKRKRKEKSIFTRSSRQERKANHPLYPFCKEILHHAANFKFLSKQHALLHL